MSKNIFDEAKTILENICIDFDEHGYAPTIPSHRDSDLHFYTIYKKEIDQINEALELGELYKELSNLYETLYSMELSELALNHNYYQIEIIKIKAKIKENKNEV